MEQFLLLTDEHVETLIEDITTALVEALELETDGVPEDIVNDTVREVLEWWMGMSEDDLDSI